MVHAMAHLKFRFCFCKNNKRTIDEQLPHYTIRHYKFAFLYYSHFCIAFQRQAHLVFDMICIMKTFDVIVNVLDNRLLFRTKKKESGVTEVERVEETPPQPSTQVKFGSQIILLVGVVQLVVLIALIILSQTTRFHENVWTPTACIVLLVMPVCTCMLSPRPVPGRAVWILLAVHDMAISMIMQVFSRPRFELATRATRDRRCCPATSPARAGQPLWGQECPCLRLFKVVDIQSPVPANERWYAGLPGAARYGRHEPWCEGRAWTCAPKLLSRRGPPPLPRSARHLCQVPPVHSHSYTLRACDGNVPAKPYLPLQTRTRHTSRRSHRHRIIEKATGNSAPHDEREEEESDGEEERGRRARRGQQWSRVERGRSAR